MNTSEIAQAAFAAYNAGGPPEKAGLTWDGKPVPPFSAVGPSVHHKWECAAAKAALHGAEEIIARIAAGETDPEALRTMAQEIFAPPTWRVTP